MKRYQNPRKTFVFVFIAALLMIITDFVFFPGLRSPMPERETTIHTGRLFEHSEIADYESSEFMRGKPPVKEDAWEISGLPLDIPYPEPVKNNAETVSKIIKNPADLVVKKDILPETESKQEPGQESGQKPRSQKKVKYAPVEGSGMVVIIIDDMGMDRKRSQQVIDLPYPLTLAFLPYAPQLGPITQAAKQKGHELIIHVPMQPLNINLDPGPLVLRDDMGAESFDLTLEKIFASFDGYVGINNHMGSKLTQNRKMMDRVMDALSAKNLMFVDSKTIPNSVAADSAADHGLAYAERDVFLDHENNKTFVMDALYDLEVIAKRRGYAIAIGHPKDVTIEGLREWLPTLKEKGLTLVPVSRVVHKPVSAAAEKPAESFGPSIQPPASGPAQPPSELPAPY